jgi:putative nucleotidyltransferase with HDIG domain
MAVESMRNDPPDALVTDLKMPGQLGTALLEHALAMRPTCFRVVLSGCAERDLVVGSLELCHRFFPKPCDAEVLVEAVESGVAELQKAMPTDLRVWAAVSKSLPAVPSLYQRLRSLLDDPDADIEKMAALIRQDSAITARLLRAANSPFFGSRQGVNSVQDAVGIIGMDAVSSVVLGCKLFGSGPGKEWQEKLWKHSLQAAALAQPIAREVGANPEAASTAALLHDSGKIILADVLGHWNWSQRVAEGKGLLPWVAEDTKFGTNHAAVGALLFELWGLPEGIVQAVRWHHQPSRCPASVSRCAAAVHLSNALAHAWSSADGKEMTCDALWLESCGIPSAMEHYADLRHLMEESPNA